MARQQLNTTCVGSGSSALTVNDSGSQMAVFGCSNEHARCKPQTTPGLHSCHCSKLNATWVESFFASHSTSTLCVPHAILHATHTMLVAII